MNIRALSQIFLTLFLFSFLSTATLPVTAQESEPGAVTEIETKGPKLPRVVLSAEARQHLIAGNWEEALDALEDMNSSPIADPNLKHYLALCHEQLAIAAYKEKDYATVIEQLDEALHYLPDSHGLVYSKGMAHFSLSQYGEAEDAFSRAVALWDDDAQSHMMLGEVYYLTGDTDNALVHLEMALELDPSNEKLKKRLEKLQKDLKAARDYETEMDSYFTVRFDGKKAPRLREKVLEMLQDAYTEIGQKLNLYPNRQISVTLMTNKAFFDITESPGWAGGVYEGQIKVPAENFQLDTLKKILYHEYVHAVIFDRLSTRCPWWLNEGLAQYFSGDGRGNGVRLEYAKQVLALGNIPPLEKLPGHWLHDEKGAKSAYSIVLSAVDYFIEYFGAYEMQSILDLMGEGQDFQDAIEEITGFSFTEFQKNWLEARGQ